MRKLTRKQMLARLIIGFLTIGSVFYTVNSSVAQDMGGSTYGTYTINGEPNPPLALTGDGISPEFSSGNSVNVTVDAADGELDGSLYGGCYHGSGDNKISNNTITITRDNNSKVKLNQVVGGEIDDSETITECKDNTVTLNNVEASWVSGADCSTGVEIDVEHNTVNVNSGSNITSSVLGGCSYFGNSIKNNVTVSASTVGVVTGGRSNSGVSTDNTVDILNSSTVNFGINGGYSDIEGATADGNTLSVKTLNATVKGISDFETVKFELPPETQKEGSVALNVTDKADMSKTRNVHVDVKAATNIHKGGEVSLIKSENGIEGSFGKREGVTGAFNVIYNF